MQPAVEEHVALGYVAEIQHFVECLRAGTQPKAGARGEDGQAALRIALAAEAAARTGRTVEIKGS